jgi:hypothetical protein
MSWVNIQNIFSEDNNKMKNQENEPAIERFEFLYRRDDGFDVKLGKVSNKGIFVIGGIFALWIVGNILCCLIKMNGQTAPGE